MTLSSILKALKKAEDQACVEKDSSPWSVPAGSAGNPRRWATFRLMLVSISIAAFVGILSAFGIIHWMGGANDKPVANTLALNKKQPAVNTKGHLAAPASKNIQKTKIVEKPVPALPDPEPAEKKEPVEPVINASYKAPAPQPEPLVDTASPAPARPATAEKVAQDKTVAVEYDFRNDQRIEMQALVWAVDPEERFAVINNRVVREGSWVDEIKIVAINKDDVLFSDTSGMWRERIRIQ